MAPKVTTSAERSKRKAKQPVRTDKGRNNRASVSEAKVTKSGDTPKGGARVTNAAQRTSTGSAPVTGGAKPVLPPGKPRPVRASIGNVSGPATTPKPPGTNANLRPGNSRTAPSIPKPQAITAKPTVKPRGIRGLNGSQKLGLEVLGIPTGVTSAATRLALSDFGSSGENPDVQARRMGFKDAEDRRRRVEAQKAKEGGGSKPKKLSRPASDYEKLFNPGGSRANYGLDKAPPAPTLPAAVTRTSSSGRSSSSSRGSSTQRSGSSSSSSAASSTSSTSSTPAKPGQKWSDFNPGSGTSKTNNPLMKDMIKRMKDREDKEQASKAQQLTDKSRQNSGYSSAEKVDGSKYQEELKKKKGYSFSVS